MEKGMRTMACGHQLEYTGDIKEYISRLLDHVKECQAAQQHLLKVRREENERKGQDV